VASAEKKRGKKARGGGTKEESPDWEGNHEDGSNLKNPRAFGNTLNQLTPGCGVPNGQKKENDGLSHP